MYSFPAILAILTLVSAAEFEIGSSVTAADGSRISGHASKWQPSVSEYLGIPFALPPVGPLRWQPPKKFVGGANTSITGAKYSPSCPANLVTFEGKIPLNSPGGVTLSSLGQRGDTFDEDCLTLNVWSKPQEGEKAKAVLVWIFGGGFALGNTNNPSYNGARLAAEKDVVVVSLNYRLNILGFPSAPGLQDQNLGLLDQRLAVEWVRDNIAAFGGDPKRITLFGESAGGASVDMYAYAWTKDPIINAFIPESGTSFLGGALGGGSSKNWFKASQKLGCGGKEAGEKSLACMQNKSWQEVMKAIKPEGSTASLGGMGDFGPVPDEKIVFKNYKARAAAGNFIKRPILVGNNAHEIGLFLVILGQSTPAIEKADLGKSSTIDRANGIFTCPSGNAAKERAAQGVKAWRYLYNAEFPNQQLDAKIFGAWHGSEIGMVFGSTEYQQTYFGNMFNQTISFPDTQAEKKMIDTMMTAWSSFAKDPDHGLEKMGWPAYTVKDPKVVKLGAANSAAVEFPLATAVDSGCGIINPLLNVVTGSGSLGGLLSGIGGGGSSSSSSSKGSGLFGGLFGGKGKGSVAKGSTAPPMPVRFRRY